MPLIIAIFALLIYVTIHDDIDRKTKIDYMLSCVSETRTKEQCEALYEQVIKTVPKVKE